jgi:hypothetical protein
MLKVALLLIGAGLSVASCASPASVSGMVTTPAATAPVPASLNRAIAVETVGGGRETNPMWTSQVGNAEFQEALTKSLQARGMHADNVAAARYALRATLMNLAQPMIGLDMTVSASVKYTLVDKQSQQMVYDRLIDSSHTATFGDAAIGVQRLRLANEGAIKKNIENFMADLEKSPPAPPPPARPAHRTGS